jgi:tight adherence protein C
MEMIMYWIGGLVADPQTQQVVFIALAAGTFFIFALGLSYVFLGATDPVRRRLIGQSNVLDEDEGPSESRLLVTINTIVGPAAHWVIPRSEEERGRTQKRLTYAGFRSPSALQNFFAIKALLTISLPVAVLFVTRWMPDLTSMQILISTGIGAGVGLIGPSYVLDKLVDKRIGKLRRAFPDALDLLVVCVESGLGLAAAIQRVADEIDVSHPELGMELALVNAEIRAGVERPRALRNLAERTGLDDIRGLVSLLVQTMRFGTSVADALRVYSEEFRDRRMQKAEEAAAKIGTKLIFPLVFCLFPSFFTVAIGPAVIRLVGVFQYLQF